MFRSRSHVVRIQTRQWSSYWVFHFHFPWLLQKNIFPWPFPDHSNSLTFSSFPWPVGTLFFSPSFFVAFVANSDIYTKNNEMNFYASAQHSVTVGILFLSCSSVRASRNVVNTIYLAEYFTHFHQIYINNAQFALWDTDERITICRQKVKRSRSRRNKVCWKQHFLGLTTWCLQKC